MYRVSMVCSIGANTRNVDRPVRFTRLDNHKRLPRFLTVILIYVCFSYTILSYKRFSNFVLKLLN